MTEKVIIGLTGSFGSGCSYVADLLKKQGFKPIPLSNILKNVAKERGIDVNKLSPKEKRSILQDIGNEKRKKDHGTLIKESLKDEKFDTDIVINSIKNPGEIEELKKIPNSYIIAIDASFDVRVKRILKSEYEDDLARFKKDNIRESDEGIDNGQKLQKCVDLADILIKNDDNINTEQKSKDFVDDIMSYVRLIKEPGYRIPTDIELWMNNAYSISRKSKCSQRQVGAVIVKKGYAVATGNNDVPPGEESCKDTYGKCYRDILKKDISICPVCGKKLDDDFSCKDAACKYNSNKLLKLLDKCRSLHAEENAILQAASLGGVSLEDGVIYSTTFPCKLCANKIVRVGICEVVYVEAYPDQDSMDFLKSRVIVTKFQGVKASAFHKLFSKK